MWCYSKMYFSHQYIEYDLIWQDHKIDIHAKDENGWTLLFFAAEHSNKQLMRWLLRMAADACAKSLDKVTPLMCLGETNSCWHVKHIGPFGRICCFFFLDSWLLTCVTVIVTFVAICKITDDSCKYATLLWETLPCNNMDAALYDLRLTAIMGNQALGNLLLEFDADIDAQNDEGATALILAIKAEIVGFSNIAWS